MNYSTEGPSWVACNSPMIKNVISNGLETQYLRLRTWGHYSSHRYSTYEVHAEFMGMNDLTRRSTQLHGTHV